MSGSSLGVSTISAGWTEVINRFLTGETYRGETQYGTTFEVLGLTIFVENASDVSIPSTYEYPELVADYVSRLQGEESARSTLFRRLHQWADLGGSRSIDQLRVAEDLLRRDPSSRHAVFVAWDPSADSSASYPISPIAGSFRIVNDQLVTQIVARSTDVLVGLVPELVAWAGLGTALANRLSLSRHSLSYHCWNLHLYEVDYVRFGAA